MTLERWKTFKKREQLLFVGSEFERARVADRDDNSDQRRAALERSLVLIDLSLKDEQWQANRAMLEELKATARAYITGEPERNIAILYQAL